MRTCSVRYVHKIAPSAKDVGPEVSLPDGCFSDKRALAKALRDAGVMANGARISTFRVEGDRILVFPVLPGSTTYWHAIVLTDEGAHAPNKRGHRKNSSSQRLSKFQQGFLEAALWSSTDNADDSGGEPLDKNYDISDIDPKTLASLLKDCDDFCEENAELLARAGDDEQNGHDFWLTRNGHGAGFWGRDSGAVGDKLSDACKPYGSVDLYVGDDGKIYA
jgi:hypothetical protein